MLPFGKRVRETVDHATDKLADTAADTKAAMTGLAVLGIAALAVALVALVVAVRKD
jgi:hypothetical protein